MGDDLANNGDTETYVAWNWKAGGAPTADNSAGAGAVPTAGSVKIDGSNLGSALAGTLAATRISANTTSGFSIIKYTGTTSNVTVGHGLSAAPELVIIKGLDSTLNWFVNDPAATPFTKYLKLDANSGSGSSSTMYQDTAPSASVVTLGTSGLVNAAEDFIMYCFHSVEGYSKVGSYTGNGSDDGTFIYTGFTPAFFMCKWLSTGEKWVMKDNKRPAYNVEDKTLEANTSTDEASSDGMELDFVSNGIKWRQYGDGGNYGSRDYIYIAFAESPFKYSNAR
jgi:hypothetical protein